MVRKIDHLGIAVRSLEAGRKFYEEVLGLKCEKVEEVESQKVKTAFFNIGGVHLELLEPTDPESPIAKFLEKNGEGVHHVAYETDNIEGELRGAQMKGVRLIHEAPFEGARGQTRRFFASQVFVGRADRVLRRKTIKKIDRP